MIKKKVLVPDRIRQPGQSFGFIPHRFLTDGFLQSLSRHETILYFFLVMAADRYGISFYGDKTICSMLGLSDDDYLIARGNLILRDLLVYDGTLFQLLSLPPYAYTL